LRALALLALALAAPSALASADEDGPCAGIEAPLAFNACLAAHGPRANAIGTATGAPAGAHADPEAGAPVRAKPPAAAFQPVERRHGRIHMEFRLR
jgi:hypothetical protein